jgi:hypothetical protein
MNTKEKLVPLLYQFASEVETGVEIGESPLELADMVISTDGWEAVRDAVVEILEDPTYQLLWEGAINILYAGIRDGKPLKDTNTFIALMYAAMNISSTNHPDQYFDTVWSLVMKLKGVGLTSDYEPLGDPDISSLYKSIMQRHLAHAESTMKIEDFLSDVTADLVSFTKTEPFVKYLFSRLNAEWIDVIQACKDLKLDDTLRYFAEISTTYLLATWLYFPSGNGEGFRMILFFSESLFWSNIAIYNAARLLRLE